MKKIEWTYLLTIYPDEQRATLWRVALYQINKLNIPYAVDPDNKYTLLIEDHYLTLLALKWKSPIMCRHYTIIDV